MQPQPPIVIDENGSLEVYASASAACADLEVIDVTNGEYEAFDSFGHRLEFNVSGEIITLTVGSESMPNLGELEARVRTYVDAAIAPAMKLANPADASLPELLQAVLAFQRGDARKRHRRNWFTGRNRDVGN